MDRVNWIVESMINGRSDRFAGTDGAWTRNRSHAATFKRKRDALAFIYQKPEIWRSVVLTGGAITGGRRDYYAVDGTMTGTANAGGVIDWSFTLAQAESLGAISSTIDDITRRLLRKTRRDGSNG